MSVTILMILACGGQSEQAPASAPMEQKASPGWGGSGEDDFAFDALEEEQDEMGEPEPEMAASPSPKRSERSKDKGMDSEGRAEKSGNLQGARDGKMNGQEGEDVAATRSWFPETFLWQPAVVTDASGVATVPITVPDTLTTWRVVGLAASREGAQAGDTHSFSSTLPVYVDPRVPDQLRSGDRVELPVRVVNTTDEGVQDVLRVSAAGVSASAQGRVSVPAGGSALEWVTVRAEGPGPATISAIYGSDDAIVRELRVEPVGRKLSDSRSGLLGSEDAVELMAEPGAEHARARLTLTPGPLGVVRSELSGVAVGGGLADEAYAYALGASGERVLVGLGVPVDDAERQRLRTLRLQSLQGLVRHARSADVVGQALLLEAAKRSPEDPVAERLAGRLRQQLMSQQLGDGSWATPAGSDLQLLLARTATLCGAVDDAGTTVRCGAVFERYGDRLLSPETGDAYTASLVLISGAGGVDLRNDLRDFVKGQVSTGADGLARVALPSGVQRADGSPVTEADALAAASLALDGDRDLAAALLGAYHPSWGFGSGQASLLALDALAVLGGEELPEQVTVSLWLDGEQIESAELRSDALRETVVLSVPAPTRGEHRWEIRSDGAWPGLSWHLDLDSWVPWDGLVGPEGLELQLEHEELELGRSAEIQLVAAAPRGQELLISHSPPVGFVIDEDSITGGSVERLDDRSLTVRVPATQEGLVTVGYTVTPTLRGSLNPGPATVALARDPELVTAVPPEAWIVR
jgi:hypothetical protein